MEAVSLAVTNGASRNTTRRDKHRKALARGRPPCHLCNEDIDYEANHLEPLAFQVDHVIPLNKGGEDVLENCRPSHRKCNRAKGDGPRQIRPPVTFVTDRAW